MTIEVSDAQLVGRCRAGEPAAWNELVQRFSRYVPGYPPQRVDVATFTNAFGGHCVIPVFSPRVFASDSNTAIS